MDPHQSVLTQHNDRHRSGAYLAEKQLKPATIGTGNFGRICSRRVDGTMAAQPLYAHGVLVNIENKPVSKNLLLVATRQNKVYAFDADNLNPDPHTAPIWVRKLQDINGLCANPLPGMDDGRAWCSQTHGPVGITSTPAIDPDTGIMYLVFRTGLPPDPDPNHHNDQYILESHHWLVALDLHTGHDHHAPVEITFPGFDPNMQLNRPGLLLNGGALYIGFGAAVCDGGGNPWLHADHKPTPHGWVFAFRASDLHLLDAFKTTQHTALAGIWQSGNGLAANAHGSVFATTGNNGVDKYQGVDNSDDQWVVAHDSDHQTELGNSILKLHLNDHGKFEPSQHFTAGNWYRLDTGARFPGDKDKGDGDTDLGSGGPILLPNGWVVAGGKQGVLYVLDPAHMSHAKQGFQAFYNSWSPDIHPCDYDKQQDYGPNIHGGLILWRPDNHYHSLLYGMPEKEYLKAFVAHDNGTVHEYPIMTTMESGIRSPDGMPGAFLSLSADGGKDGILWVSVAEQNNSGAGYTKGEIKGRLLAFDALTLRLLWHADDDVAFAKFVPPTVAGGKVFRAAYQDEVVIYGLRDTTHPIEQPRFNQVAIRPISAVWRDPNHLDLFMTATHGAVVSTYLESSTWCGWHGWRGWFPIHPTLGPQRDAGPASPGQPVATLWSKPNYIDLFITSTDGRVLTTFWDQRGGGSGWFAISPSSGRAVPGQTVTAVWRDPKHLDLFITASDGHILSTFWEFQGGWSDWFAISPSSGRAVPGQTVTAVWRDPKHLDLFITASDGHILSTFWEFQGGWSDWFAISPSSGRAVPGQTVTAVWRDPKHLDLFITASDGRILSIFWEQKPNHPDGWEGKTWFPIDQTNGHAAPGQPVTAVWSNPDHLDLFITASDGRILSIFWEQKPNHPDGWEGKTWFPIDQTNGHAAPGQPITAVWSNPDHLDLFITASDGRVLSTFWEFKGGWREWFAL